VRVNKAFVQDRWRLTLFGEVINVFNRENVRFDDFNGLDAFGRPRLSFEKTFPILPSLGIAVEF